jgi:hypothetical protein
MRQMARENYFTTLEIPFLRGRGFTAQDDAHAPQVAIVNQTFARATGRYLSGYRTGISSSAVTIIPARISNTRSPSSAVAAAGSPKYA